MKLKIFGIHGKASFDAWKTQIKTKILTKIPMLSIISWYTFICYLFFGLIFKNYSLKVVGFAFAVFFIYEKIKDDYWESRIAVAKAI